MLEASTQGRNLAYAEVPGVGVFNLETPQTGDIATLLVPYHENKLIQALEINWLANYLRVLNWHDGVF